MEDFPPLTDGMIVLRPARPEEAKAMLEALEESKGEVPVWLPETDGLELQGARQFIATWPKMRQERSAFHFGIFDPQTGGLLGGCGLTQINMRHHICNAYYWVRTSATGRGIASRAARLMARFAFDELHMQRMEIVAEVENLPSIRAAEKAGATREGVLRSRLNNRGQPRDAVMFSLIPQDLESTVGHAPSRPPPARPRRPRRTGG
jgi:ribosomal-protein-serine acetyltransferase